MKSNKLGSSNRQTVVRKLKTISFGKGLRSHQNPVLPAKVKTDGLGLPVPALPAKSLKTGKKLDKLPNKTLSANQDTNLAKASESLVGIKSQSGVDITEKVKELIALAREQGFLSYEDIDDVLAEP